jgi:hypothetical protein
MGHAVRFADYSNEPNEAQLFAAGNSLRCRQIRDVSYMK